MLQALRGLVAHDDGATVATTTFGNLFMQRIGPQPLCKHSAFHGRAQVYHGQ